MIVYKYLSAERIDVLKGCRIRFTQPSALNDPLDTKPSTAHYRNHKIFDIVNGVQQVQGPSELVDRVLEDQNADMDSEIRRFFDDHYPFLSLSRKHDNLLMWSHYANYHRGFVIGFDAESPFFRNENELHCLRDVVYSNERPRFPVSGFASLSPQDGWQVQMEMLFTKSKDWKYEKEMRLLADPKAIPKKKSKPGTLDICLYQFPRDSVREIIFGCKMSDINRAKVLKAAIKYPQAKILVAELDDLTFRLRISPFEKV